MRHHDSDPHDALNDYLDSLAGAPPPDSHAGNLDPDMRDGVDRFFDLAERAGMASADTRRPDMNAPLPAKSAFLPSEEETRHSFLLLPSTRILHMLSTGLLIVVIIALAIAAFGPNGIRNGGNDGNGDGPSLNGAVPIATVPEGAETSSIPFPTADECTVEPMTREELTAHFQAANVATAPEHELYEQPRQPSAADADAIVQTYREWRACGLFGGGAVYAMWFQTPWFTANTSGLFLDPSLSSTHRPISDADIASFVDILLGENLPTPDAGELTAIHPYPTVSPDESAASAGSGDAQTRNLPWHPTPAITADSTPVAPEHRGHQGSWQPNIFADDIVLTGPNTGSVTARYIDDRTGEEISIPPITYTFVKVDGQWLLDTYTDEARE